MLFKPQMKIEEVSGLGRRSEAEVEYTGADHHSDPTSETLLLQCHLSLRRQ